MVISSDSPIDPESGRVVDSEVLEERRARRVEGSEEPPAERVAAGLVHRLAEAEAGLATAQRERALLARALERAEHDLTATLLERELGRRAAVPGAVTAQIAELHRALEGVQTRVTALSEDASAAVTGAVAETRRLRGALTTLEDEQRRSAAGVEPAAAEAVRARADGLATELQLERERRAELQALAETERARFAAELASTGVILRAAVERGRRTAEARLSEMRRAAERERAQLEAAVSQLDRRLASERAAREAVERELAAERDARAAEADARAFEAAQISARLAAAEVTLAEAHELAALAAERDSRLGGEREAFAAELTGMQARVTALREQLEEERAAHRVARAELARETAQRAAAEQRATAALDAPAPEPARRRAPDGANPVYDALTAGPLVPSADHPALWRPEAGELSNRTEPPTVVVDLARAAARLRAAGESGSALAGDAGGVEEVADPEEAGASGEDGEAGDAGALPAAAAEPAREDSVIPAALRVAPTIRPWFAPALARLAGVDAATAERLLLAALAVQADRVDKKVVYAVVLPATGRHHVQVGPRGGVVVVPPGVRAHHDVEFSLEGSVEALAPLATGGAPRRLRGVTVRGRRRRLRRLLRALPAPVGLGELQAAGARPRPGDLLALLCLGVPAETVRGADFSVAYTVCGPGGSRTRTLVRAEPDGSLTAIPEAPDLLPADATVTVGADGLLGVLAGTAPVRVAGDARAVATLQGWLHGVQEPVDE